MSLFNRPSWAKTQTTTSTADEAPDNIFSHSDRSYREIVAERERKKLAKAEKEKRKSVTRDERNNVEKREPRAYATTAPSSPKRRRISLEDDDDNDEEATPQRLAEVDDMETIIAYDDEEHGELYEESEAEVQRPLRRSPRKPRYDATDTASIHPQEDVVELRDSDSDDYGGVKLPPVAQPKPVELLDDESDDEFAELARRARQQQQTESAGKKESQRSSTLANSASPNADQYNSSTGDPAVPPPDPTVQLFITSHIEDTNPMIVYRKLSQNIADVRRVWCAKQGFSDRKTAEVYFVHRMRRVYDVTTCKSLGIEVDSLGNLSVKGAEGKENVENLHLEAVTDEIFRQMKAEREREKQLSNSDVDTTAGTEGEEALPVDQQSDSLIRLLLKARGRDDFKLKVKPTTPFSRIIAAYTKTQQLGDSVTVRLEFDGEQLAPDDEVQATEIADLDCIDVHLIPTS